MEELEKFPINEINKLMMRCEEAKTRIEEARASKGVVAVGPPRQQQPRLPQNIPSSELWDDDELLASDKMPVDEAEAEAEAEAEIELGDEENWARAAKRPRIQ